MLGSAGAVALLPLIRAIGGVNDAFAADLASLGQVDDLTGAYSLDPDITYLNHASIGTMPRAVAKALHAYLELAETNPYLHMWGDAWQQPREDVRALAAQVLSVDAGDVALTHNTTEAFNLMARGLELGEGDEVLFPSVNHQGASVAWTETAKRRRFSVRSFDFPLADAPSLSADDMIEIYRREIRDETEILILPHVDYIVGLRQPVRRIAALAKSLGVRFVAVDAAQSVGMIPIDLEASHIDLFATSGHKWLQGPKGTGFTYLSPGLRDVLEPLWVTWGQERWAGTVRIFEDYGTRNLPELLALGNAIRFNGEIGLDAAGAHHRKLRAQAMARVDDLDGVSWASPRDFDNGAALYAIELDGELADDAFARINQAGIFLARAFGAPAPNIIRISPNVMTRERDLDRFFDALAGV